MSVLEWTGVGLATLAFVAGYLWLDRLANQWFRGLPEPIRKHGLLGLAVRRLFGRGRSGR